MNRRLVLFVVLAVLVLTSVAAAEGTVPFRFAILSDRTGGHTEGIWPKVIEAINAEKPDFVITIGDHIEGYGEDYELVEAEWDTALAMLRQIDAPVYMTPGNHDIWDARSEEIYVARTGRKPFYSFDYANSHFVILDNSRMESWDALGLSQAVWVARDLGATDKDDIFVFFHKPFWERTLRHGGPDPLHQMFVDEGVMAVFNGHYHTYMSGDFDGIEYTAIGSSGGVLVGNGLQPQLRGTFFQYGIVDVTRDGFELTIHDLDGNVYPRDFVTVGLLDEIDRIENDLIKVSPLTVNEDAAASSDIQVTVRNDTGEPLSGEAVWSVPEQWSVEPQSEPFSVPAGASADLAFRASKTGGIYPAPEVKLSYPLADGRTLEVEKPARILRKVEAPRVAAGPKLDGVPDADLIDDGAVVRELYTGQGYEPVDGQTEFVFAHDSGDLIVTALCYDSKMDEIRADAKERDGAVYMDDCVGFFLQPDPDEMVVYQMYVNPDGVVFDQKITFDESMWYTVHPEWNGDYRIATHRDADRWVAEIVVPYGTLGEVATEASAPGLSEAKEGLTERTVVNTSSWGLNFRRKQARTWGSADWQVPIDYDPRTFGRIDMK